MYLAKLSTLQTQAPFYINILEGILKGNFNPDSKTNLDDAITQAIGVAKEEVNVFAIDNNHYFIVTTLLSKLKEQLKGIDSDNYSNEIYSEILEVLK